MLYLADLDRLDALAMRVGALADAFEARDVRFPERVSTWLIDVEQELSALRLGEASSVAAWRSSIAAAARGVVPSDVAMRGRASRSRTTRVLARAVMQRTAELLDAIAQPDRTRAREAEAVARQVAAILKSRACPSAPQFPDPNDLHRAMPGLRADEQVGHAIVHIEGLVGSRDAIALLLRVVAEEFAETPSVQANRT